MVVRLQSYVKHDTQKSNPWLQSLAQWAEIGKMSLKAKIKTYQKFSLFHMHHLLKKLRNKTDLFWIASLL